MKIATAGPGIMDRFNQSDQCWHHLLPWKTLHRLQLWWWKFWKDRERSFTVQNDHHFLINRSKFNYSRAAHTLQRTLKWKPYRRGVNDLMQSQPRTNFIASLSKLAFSLRKCTNRKDTYSYCPDIGRTSLLEAVRQALCLVSSERSSETRELVFN